MILCNYMVSVFLIMLGLYTVCTRKNLIKIVLGLGIIDYGVNMLIVGDGKALTFVDYSVKQVQRWPIGNSPLGVLINPDRDISGYAKVVPSGEYVRIEAQPSDRDGATVSGSGTYQVGSTATLTVTTNSGYTFVGWNTEPDGSGTAYKNKQMVRNLASGEGEVVTLYAQWEPKTYKVSLPREETSPMWDL